MYKSNLSDIAKTNFTVSSILTNQKKYDLFQMVVETFADASFISPASASDVKKYKIANGGLYGKYDFTGGAGGTGTSSYTGSIGTSSFTVSGVSGRAATGSTSMAGMFDETLGSATTSNSLYATGSGTNKSEDILTFSFTQPLNVNKIVIFPYMSGTHNFSGILFTNNGSGMTNEGNFEKGSAKESNTSLTVNKSSISSFKFTGKGDSSTHGTTGYAINEVAVIPPSVSVVSSTIATGMSSLKRIMFSADEDLSSTESSVQYSIAFDVDGFSSFVPIQKDVMFTSIPASAASFRVKIQLLNGAGVKAYAAGWS